MRFSPKKDPAGLSRPSLVAFLLALVLLLSGCSGVFADNPVVQTMQHTSDNINLSIQELDSLFDEYDLTDRPQQKDDVFETHQAVFDDFLAELRKADGISYQRTLSFSTQEPSLPQDIDHFFGPGSLEVTEVGDEIYAQPLSGGKAFFFDGVQGYFMQDDAKEKVRLEDNIHQTFLLTLGHDTDLELIKVEDETAGETVYTAYSVTENDQLAKWYFDENDQLFLRIFHIYNVPCAIRYDYLNFDPELAGTPWDTTTDAGETSEEDADKKPEKEETPEKSSPSESKTEASPSPAQPPAARPDTPVKQPAQPAVPEKEGSALGPADQQDPAHNPHYVPDYSVDSNVPQADKEKPTVKEPEEPQVPRNYPDRIVGLIPGYTLISATDDQDGINRVIYLKLQSPGFIDTTLRYYSAQLEDQDDFRRKDIEAVEDGYNYILLSATKQGWICNVEIAESHKTTRCTVTIRLER